MARLMFGIPVNESAFDLVSKKGKRILYPATLRAPGHPRCGQQLTSNRNQSTASIDSALVDASARCYVDEFGCRCRRRPPLPSMSGLFDLVRPSDRSEYTS